MDRDMVDLGRRKGDFWVALGGATYTLTPHSSTIASNNLNDAGYSPNLANTV